ncbi:hypothetical protein [Streptomyces sp. NPDC056255]|uniref:hypothetical protein n=1 Tax=Streptomyces sp. NPDC056255 TaxID=3345764 RepID=UPI0035E02FAC
MTLTYLPHFRMRQPTGHATARRNKCGQVRDEAARFRMNRGIVVDKLPLHRIAQGVTHDLNDPDARPACQTGIRRA